MKHIQHVFFDLDHTLWDFEKNSALTFKKILHEYSVNVSFESFIDIYKPINANYWKLYREERVSKEKLRYGRLNETFEKLNYNASDDLINLLSEKYIEHLPSFNHLFEGTFELLEYLQDKYVLHIITNGFEEVQTVKMEKSGILSYFNEIITSESVGVKKPNPKVFKYALEKANAKSENSLMIGDNLEADIQGALNCNFSVIHCNFDEEKVKLDNLISVTSLNEIMKYL
ncbi:YjjG family noncanonical pyrimidine nucleotidase [Flavobacteriaceae bacterium S356]|uniref:YjjG family noncanonical pyrimidine nucleotidase n=1 Tax=Asprobacillus argus TaxID=3076534 RepID=A0ABU3LIP0_9FLAO|nr:YjjG family noncanonical pyrimidine nucleotidase [Flavobacteriaceae bacterium S356]